MRIAVVNNFFPPRVGGSAHMSASLAAQFAEAGHEVLAITAAYADAPAEEERDGYRVVRLPAMKMPQVGLSIDFDMSFASLRPGNWRRLWKLLNEFKPDAIHLHGQFFDLSWLAGIYARRPEHPGAAHHPHPADQRQQAVRRRVPAARRGAGEADPELHQAAVRASSTSSASTTASTATAPATRTRSTSRSRSTPATSRSR